MLDERSQIAELYEHVRLRLAESVARPEPRPIPCMEEIEQPPLIEPCGCRCISGAWLTESCGGRCCGGWLMDSCGERCCGGGWLTDSCGDRCCCGDWQMDCCMDDWLTDS